MKTQTEMNVRRFSDTHQLIQEAAQFIQSLAKECVLKYGAFMIALSGGQTPKPLYELLAQPPYKESMPWADTHIFWGDERAVPPDHPESNYHLAREALLSKILIPESHIHCMPAEQSSLESAAHVYENTLRDTLRLSNLPTLDLILLGIGEDGHTASLFPSHPVLKEQTRWVMPVDPQGKPRVARLTFTLPLINSAKNVLFLVTEKSKSAVVQTILSNSEQAKIQCPAALVRPQGKLLWYLRTR